MARNQSIAGFLRDQLHYPASDALAHLDRLAGEKIASTEFLSDLDAARDLLKPWMPLFYLPVASTSVRVGLHLRPLDVESRRLAFIAAEAPGQFIETALSLDQLVYLGLLGSEGYGNSGKMPTSFPDAVAKANEVFGAGFYQAGRHGNFQSGDEPRVMIEAFGGTPEALRNQAVLADDPAEKLKYWERGIALGMESLALYGGAARIHLELGRRREAAEHFARSLECYHDTAYDVDLDEYFEMGRPLLREFPQLFSEDAAWQLQETNPRRWATRVGELFKAGQVERADKLLNDLCHGTGDYTSVVGAFRKHYETLGWDWALALCDLRS
jgi:tetratricopeptide (TPR) repeat protein